MSYALINNYAISIAQGEASESTTAIGDSDRTAGGALIRSLRANKRTWLLAMPPTTPTLADCLRHLILGEGDVWHFNESTSNDWQWSVKGLGKASGSASSLAGGKFSRGVRIAATGQVTWTTNTGASWTVMVWYYTGGAWVHYIVTSGGDKWVDGVSNNAASTPFIANTSTTTTLGDAASAGNQDFDDLVVLPYVLHADVAVAFGTNTAAFSDLPNLNLRGDIHSESSAVVVACIADVTADHVQATYSGSLAVGRAYAFELAEV